MYKGVNSRIVSVREYNDYEYFSTVAVDGLILYHNEVVPRKLEYTCFMHNVVCARHMTQLLSCTDTTVHFISWLCHVYVHHPC